MNKKLFFNVWRVLLALAFSLALAGVPALPVSATGVHLYVATTGSNAGANDCQTESSPCLTVTYAISQATTDDIIHIAAGTYLEAISVDKSLSFIGAGMDQTSLDANYSNRVVNITGLPNVSFSDLTIQNGNTTSWGGGINTSGGTLSLTRVKVRNNLADTGGGISSFAVTTLDQCIISGNTAYTGTGGGMTSGGNVTMTDCTVSGNSTTGTSANGGGLSLLDGSVSISRSTISGNTATGVGGGIHIQGGSSKTLTNVTISGNTAFSGGGIHITSTFSTEIINSTITNNHFSSGGSNGGVLNYAVIAFKNTIVSYNDGNNCYNHPTGTTWTSLGYNLDSGATCAFTQTGDLQNTDPQLGALGNNGGLTQTHALPVGSPAIDAGTNTGCPATDQRGVARPYPVGGTCDIGAYEYESPNSLPTDISLTNDSVPENQPAGTVVGTLSTMDADLGDTHIYSFACAVPGADDTSFAIVGNALNTAAIFDYETKNSYAICIRTDDGNGGTFDENFGINVTNVLETFTTTIPATAAQDGWLLESGESTNLGGSMNSTSTTLRLGDDAAKKQYRSLLSFNTAFLPDNAVITKVTLKVRRQTVVGGGNPITTFQGFMFDIRKGTFGTLALQTSDFQTVGQKTVGPFTPALVGGWYSFNLTSTKVYINKLATLSGVTQIRLRFKLDDNNNTLANYLSLYSGNAGTTSRPTLVIEYYLP